MGQDSINHEVHLNQGRFGLSLLNSMIGEYLERENNPLAVHMGFYHQSQKLSFDSPLSSQMDIPLSNKVVVFVHGLSNLENVWDYPPDDGTTSSILSHYIDVYLDEAEPLPDQNYGTKLKDEYGYTPLFLRYNSGISLEKNGRLFNQLLNTLHKHYPIRIDDLVLIGYGMGGKLLSHTQYTAQRTAAPWLASLKRCVYLGNLNEGSVLSMLFRLGGILLRKLPVYYNDSLANWMDQKSKRLQAQSTTRKRYRQTNEVNALTAFLEDSRHMFINGDLNSEQDDNTARDFSLTPPSAPTHSQNAYLEGISPIRLPHTDKVYDLISGWIKSQAPDAIELKTAPRQLAFPIQYTGDEAIPNTAVNRMLIAGTVDLMASAYDKTVETIETMHYSIVEEPFYALDKVPVFSQIANPVEATQREILDSFYRGLRTQGKKIHQFAADIV